MSGTTTKTQNKNIMKSAIQTDKSLFQIPKEGDVIEGIVIGKEGGVLYIDLGHVGTGVVYGAEYIKAHDEIKKLNEGDKLTGKIIEVENEDGYRELSLKEAKEEKNWQLLQSAQNKQEVVEVEIGRASCRERV